jgi:hypothetical protein
MAEHGDGAGAHGGVARGAVLLDGLVTLDQYLCGGLAGPCERSACQVRWYPGPPESRRWVVRESVGRREALGSTARHGKRVKALSCVRLTTGQSASMEAALQVLLRCRIKGELHDNNFSP